MTDAPQRVCWHSSPLTPNPYPSFVYLRCAAYRNSKRQHAALGVNLGRLIVRAGSKCRACTTMLRCATCEHVIHEFKHPLKCVRVTLQACDVTMCRCCGAKQYVNREHMPPHHTHGDEVLCSSMCLTHHAQSNEVATQHARQACCGPCADLEQTNCRRTTRALALVLQRTCVCEAQVCCHVATPLPNCPY